MLTLVNTLFNINLYVSFLFTSDLLYHLDYYYNLILTNFNFLETIYIYILKIKL